MLARFFIDRPVLAWVLSLVIILLGAIAADFLPIAEYPEVTPPTVRVTANYPGANAKVVADTVTAPIPALPAGATPAAATNDRPLQNLSTLSGASSAPNPVTPAAGTTAAAPPADRRTRAACRWMSGPKVCQRPGRR